MDIKNKIKKIGFYGLNMWYSLLYSICSLFPIKANKVFVYAFSNQGYGDHPKYIHLALKEISNDFRFYWVSSNMDSFCEILKMFAVTEGGCDPNELGHINSNSVCVPMDKFRNGNIYSLQDEVTMFVYRKRKVILK